MPFQRVGIVGSGIMAAGIAQVAATHGFPVLVKSRSAASATSLLGALQASLDRQHARGQCSEEERHGALARVLTTTTFDHLAGCDLVIEAIAEDLFEKKAVFRTLGQVCSSHAVLATTTSTLPVVELAVASGAPGRVCGIHFFNPAPLMALVEIVRTIVVAPDTLARAHAFAAACRKEAVEVQDRAGFVVNALLFGYLNSAVRLLGQHVATMEGIDAAMKGGCGFPMGPFALLDLIGLDTSLSILDALFSDTAEPQYAAAPLLRRMATAGLLGRKSGRGFYQYPRT